MAKERHLTILVPIKDTDCEATVYANAAALANAVPPSVSNINKIYKLQDGTYMRVWLNATNGLYEYHAVTDREFPYLGDPMEIYDFKYDATRMGNAPTISAQGIMRYADKDGQGIDVTLEDLWNQECHVVFNGEKFYLKRIPTSSKSNEDARYKYDMDFVSQRVVLEQVYLYDVVQPYVTEKPLSESATFSFYGDINELAKRINASLIRSNLSTLTRKYTYYPSTYEEVLPSLLIPYLTYEQWNLVEADPMSLVGEGNVFGSIFEWRVFRYEVFNKTRGDYNLYLMNYIYENENGVYTLSGYQCKIGKDKEGNASTSEEKLITFDNNKIHEALQQFHDTFGLQYYIKSEKDSSGNFTGNVLIMVADCEHDFADVTGYDQDGEPIYSRDSNGLPTTTNPFDYGSTEALMSKEKANTTDNIVTRITGVGSSENIPWYYPNPNPDGWIRPIFKELDQEQNDVTIEYPISEGETIEESIVFEKYLKNRIGQKIEHGVLKILKYGNEYFDIKRELVGGVGTTVVVTAKYSLQTNGISSPVMTFGMKYNPSESGCNRFATELIIDNVQVSSYDSSQSYPSPSVFQTMCSTHDGKVGLNLATNKSVFFNATYYIPLSAYPPSRRYDYSGYYYPATVVEYQAPSGVIVVGQNKAYIGENFYEFAGLEPNASWSVTQSQQQGVIVHNVHPIAAGYSNNGASSGIVAPRPRVNGRKYLDAVSGDVYLCYDSSPSEIASDDNQYAFQHSPIMGADEWLKTFFSTTIRLVSNDGWYIGNKSINLEDYGLGSPKRNGETFAYNIFDTIEFQRVKYVTPQQNLMPELYIKTDGERRFYDAHNYWDEANGTLYEGTADPMLGEVQVDSKVRNPIYKEKETDPDSKHYKFENEYLKKIPHEHIENFDDAKPSIVGQRNEVGGALIRIDVVEEFGYDLTDNDEIWENNDGGSVSGDYKHPYFFAKLRPMGFNIFGLALQDEMVVSMTTGNCGACNFKIGVDENTKKNPVQLWEYDVYGGETFADMGDRIYKQGDLRRYVNTVGLYYDMNGEPSGYVPVDSVTNASSGGTPSGTASSVPMYDSYAYSAIDVENGFVGSMRQGGSQHFEGDVVTSGRFIASQQDTSTNYVWVALMKDTDAYGTIMPSAKPNYADTNLNVYIRPKSISDVHTEESDNDDDEENADKFVLTNIKMPQMYLRRAERYLSRKLVAYMYDNNYQKFNFSIKFSSIFLAQNPSVDGNTNENSVIYVRFNGKTYRQYVKHYTYTMRHDSPLPEITVDMNEELNVSRTLVERQNMERKVNNNMLTSHFGALAQQIEYRMGQRTVSKNDTTVVYGNIIMQGTGTSLTQVSQTSSATAQTVNEIRDEVQVIANDNYLEWEEI